MENQFTKQELGILKQHVKSSVVYHSLNDTKNSDAFISTGGELVAKICMLIEIMTKEEMRNEAKKEKSAEVDGKTEATTAAVE